MDNLKKVLKKYWGYDTFRNGQEEIIQNIINKKNSIVVMPTGGGKSLCYQLPSLVMHGTAIVISPLIALMKDQVDSLLKLNIPATLINSSITYEEMQQRIYDTSQGKYKLLYIAPERLASDKFINLLKNIHISFIAVDEAHCISEWGHDFRPSYLNIAKSLKTVGDLKFVALTATATPEVREDIKKQLELTDYNEFVRGFDRPNLSYITEETLEKSERLIEILNQCDFGSSIIYSGSRKRAEKYTAELRKEKINAEVYHGGMQPNLRKVIQDRFINGETKVIVATNAFGMGIDKPDVRNVIHTDLTQTLEAYYQEAGRAGRDGKPSNCYLLYHPSDINLQDFFIKTTHPEKQNIINLSQFLIDYKKHILNLYTADKIQLNIPEFSEETGLSKRLIINILKLFEKENLISVYKASAKGKIKIIASMTRLKEYLNNTNDDRKSVLEAILKNVDRKSFYEFVDFDFISTKKMTQLNNEIIENEIKNLIYDNIIIYRPATSTSTISLNYQSVNEINLDFDKLEKRRKHANQKLEKVIEYAETNNCKRNFILKYFKDENINGVCGKCSSCLIPKRNKKIDERNKFLMHNIIAAVAEMNNLLSKNSLYEFLKGNQTKQIIAFKMNKADYFGVLKKINDKMIKNEIDTAIRYRYIEIEQSKFRPLKVTESGKKILNDNNVFFQQFIKKNDTQTNFSNNSDEIKFNKENLKKIRKSISEKNKITPRSVLSDKILNDIVKFKPKNIAELKSIKGISKYFIENYAEQLLGDLNQNKMNLSQLDKRLIELIENKSDRNIIKNKLGLSYTDQSISIQNILESGIKLNLEYLFNPNSFKKINDYLINNKFAPLRKFRSEINLEEDYSMIRIMVAYAKSELSFHNDI